MKIELSKPIMWKLDTKKDKKYRDFYNFIKQLVKNGNLDEKLVREKIKEMENRIKSEDYS